uniref:CPBP family glutamic-type intramembrane protease n=1 Tax=Paenibacillus sp. FSL R10-2734 TaxID=2954691 RepID=UPI00403F124D
MNSILSWFVEGNVYAMPVNFISGVVFAWTYERTGSVVPGMIVHGVFNTIAVLLTAMG